MRFYISVDKAPVMRVPQGITYLGSNANHPGLGHGSTAKELPVEAVGEVLHDYAGIAFLDLEVIDGSYVLMG